MPTKLSDILKNLEKETNQRMEEAGISTFNMPPFTTGSSIVDNIIGGFPRGRLIEIFSEEGIGKTTLVLSAIAANRKKYGNIGVYFDFEGGLQNKEGQDYLAQLSLKPNEDVLIIPSFFLEDLDKYIMEDSEFNIFKIKEVGIIVFDSAPAIMSEKLQNDPMDKEYYDLGAKKLSLLYRKLNVLAAKYQKCIIIINQMRANIQTNPFARGPAMKSAGGSTLKFFASIRIQLKLQEYIEENKLRIGSKLRITAVKNKVQIPFREVIVPILFGKGIDNVYLLQEDLKAQGIIIDNGRGHYVVNVPNAEETKLHGEDKLRQYVEQHLNLLEGLLK